MEPRFLPTESAMGHSDNMKSKTMVFSITWNSSPTSKGEFACSKINPKLEINVTRIGEEEEDRLGQSGGKCGPEEWSRTEEKFSLGPGTSLIHLSQQFSFAFT